MKTNMLNKDPLTPGTCEWCGKDCEVEDACCSLSCEAQLARLEAVQGTKVIRILKRWRKNRGRKGTPGEGAMTEATALVDRFLKNDRRRREEAALKRRVEAEEAATQKPVEPVTTAPRGIDPSQPDYQPEEDQARD